MALYLDSIRPRAAFAEQAGFPFTLPLIRNLSALRLTAPATFFVGENGSGKSTLLEAIAAGLNAVAIGSAAILLFAGGAIRPVAWDAVEHVALTRAFLANPGRFLDKL